MKYGSGWGYIQAPFVNLSGKGEKKYEMHQSD